ncbi:MAG TPA: hypothetical protein VGF33_06030 [Caulobacteraceae bacterium]|jgi:hypothetical protein
MPAMPFWMNPNATVILAGLLGFSAYFVIRTIDDYKARKFWLANFGAICAGATILLALIVIGFPSSPVDCMGNPA